jgi:transcriptional regulator with XRE-family HTH domain
MEKSIYSRDYSSFLKQLRKARIDSSLTQADLAKRLGQTQSFISKVERGERRLDVVELRSICSALGVPFPSFAEQLEKTLGSQKIDEEER